MHCTIFHFFAQLSTIPWCEASILKTTVDRGVLYPWDRGKSLYCHGDMRPWWYEPTNWITHVRTFLLINVNYSGMRALTKRKTREKTSHSWTVHQRHQVFSRGLGPLMVPRRSNFGVILCLKNDGFGHEKARNLIPAYLLIHELCRITKPCPASIMGLVRWPLARLI